MFLVEIADGIATFELFPDHCLLLAHALDEPNHAASESEKALYRALATCFEAAAVACRAQDEVPGDKRDAVAYTAIRFEKWLTDRSLGRETVTLSTSLDSGHYLLLDGEPMAPFEAGDLVVYKPGERAISGAWVVVRLGDREEVAVLRRRFTMYSWEIDTAQGTAGIDESHLLGPVVGLFRKPARAPKRPPRPTEEQPTPTTEAAPAS